MYDAVSLTAHLGQAGFIDLSEMPSHQSRIDKIEEIEKPEQIIDGAGICIECINHERK